MFVFHQKLFVVPTYSKAQAKIPYSRVNHNKYMVTDNVAYVGKCFIVILTNQIYLNSHFKIPVLIYPRGNGVGLIALYQRT